MMCHEDMGKSSSSEVKRKGDDQQAAPWCCSEKEHYRCDVYCEKYREGRTQQDDAEGRYRGGGESTSGICSG